jgi:hypothetical protein
LNPIAPILAGDARAAVAAIVATPTSWRYGIMPNRALRSSWILALILLGGTALRADAQDHQPSALELAQLPKFCYAQFKVPKAVGPEYTIHDCGPGMNHYCYGLLDLVRARAYQANKASRLNQLSQAEQSIGYTEGWMKDYPSCPLRDHVAASRAELQHLKSMYGYQRPRPVK